MTDVAPALVTGLIALQFVAFGWRINREITVGDQNRLTWFPIPDWLNMFSLTVVITTCLILPLAGLGSSRAVRSALAFSYVLIGFHPFAMAAHYRLFSKEGRGVYLKPRLDDATGKQVIDKCGKPVFDGDYPPFTGQEVFVVIVAVVLAVTAWCVVWHAPAAQSGA